MVWKDYLYNLKEKKGKIENISFRNKLNGWKNYNFYSQHDGSEFCQSHKQNIFMKGFLSDLYIRPSCYKCSHKSGRSLSDLTIADFWGIQNIHPDLDDDLGTSLLLINTLKGKKILEFVECNFYPTDFTSAIKAVITSSLIKHILPTDTASLKSIFKTSENISIDEILESISDAASVVIWQPSAP